MTIEEPTSPEQEQEARTIRGTRRWMQSGLGLLWLSILSLVHLAINSMSAPQILWTATGQPTMPVFLSFCGFIIGVIILLIGHLFVVLEPAAFADRSIRVWLSLAFASLGLLAILPILTKIGRPVIAAGLGLLLAVVIVLYILALRTDLRWLLPVALMALFALAALGGA